MRARTDRAPLAAKVPAITALAIAVFGTGASDTLHIVLGIPYGGTTALWAVVLAGIFWQWHLSCDKVESPGAAARGRRVRALRRPIGVHRSAMTPAHSCTDNSRPL